jgi:hypothetical protein
VEFLDRTIITRSTNPRSTPHFLVLPPSKLRCEKRETGLIEWQRFNIALSNETEGSALSTSPHNVKRAQINF